MEDGGTVYSWEVWVEVPRSLAFFSEVDTALFLICAAVVCFLLSRMLIDIRRGNPFTKSNQRRTYLIAAFVALGAYGPPFVNALVTQQIFEHFGATSDRLGDFVTPANGDLAPLLFVGVIVVFSEVFRLGRVNEPAYVQN